MWFLLACTGQGDGTGDDKGTDSGGNDSQDTSATTGTAGAPDCREEYADATLITVESVVGEVYAIDPSTAGVTSLSALSGLGVDSNLNSSAFRADGTAIVSDATTRGLVSVDPCTGVIEVIGETGVGALCGVSFGPGGLLYGLDGENNQLVTLDPSTGLATAVGPLGFDLGTCGLAHDCVNDTLIGVDGQGSALFTVDAASGVVVDTIAVPVAFGAVGAEYDPRDETILASTGTQLYRIAVGAGTAELVGAFGGTGNWDDLAYLTARLPCQ